MNHWVYILKNDKNKLYIGQTTDLDKRLLAHNKKRGSLFTSKFANFEIVYFEKYDNILDAMRREKQLKRWSRSKKEALIQGDVKKLKEL